MRIIFLWWIFLNEAQDFIWAIFVVNSAEVFCTQLGTIFEGDGPLTPTRSTNTHRISDLINCLTVLSIINTCWFQETKRAYSRSAVHLPVPELSQVYICRWVIRVYPKSLLNTICAHESSIITQHNMWSRVINHYSTQCVLTSHQSLPVLLWSFGANHSAHCTICYTF